MKESVYIETTIVSYLTANPSKQIRLAADQLVTQDWWDTQRNHFDLVTSELTILEASSGNAKLAAERLKVLSGITTLNSSPAAEALANALVSAFALPQNQFRDALHIAIAAGNGINYLLTWNCKHLANGILRHRIEETCSKAGFRAPTILTPSQLFDEAHHGRRNRSD